MLLSASTDRRSSISFNDADSFSAGSSTLPSVFIIKNLLGCGYVGN